MKMQKNNLVYFIIFSVILISCGSNFDKEKWKYKISEREAMISDLTNNILPGLSKDEIIAILGKSDSEYFENVDLVYNIGLEKSYISIDNKWLLINLDKKGYYKRFELRTDSNYLSKYSIRKSNNEDRRKC